MYTLRLSRPLLARFAPADPEVGATPRTTTSLGDWYVRSIHAAGRDLLLCTSEASGLSIVMPAERLGELPEHLVRDLIALLHTIGVPPAHVAAEADAMTDGIVGAARNPQATRAMQVIARRARTRLAEMQASRLDVGELHRALAGHRGALSGKATAAERAASLLHRSSEAPQRRKR